MKLPIRLDQFLKLMDITQTGGHAKLIIQNGEVQVNGEICTQRGKKLHAGDIIEFQSKKWTVPLQSV